MRRKPNRAVAVGVVLAVVVLVAAIVLFVVVPRVVAAKIEAAASRRALTIAYGSAAYRFTRAEVRDATITPKTGKRVTLRAPLIDARIHGLSPTWILFPRLDATVSGGLDEVVAAIDPVRKADEALPPAERLPIDVQGGTFTWKEPFGDESSIVFGDMRASVRPAEALVTATLRKGRMTLPHLALDGLSVDVKRSTKAGERLDLRASLGGLAGEDGHARIDAHRVEGETTLDVDVEQFGLSNASPKLQGLDLSLSVVDATVHAERSAEGAVRSNGKLAITKLRLPPVKVGPVSVAVGGTVRVSWKGTPKKGAPGTMLIDDGKVEVVLGGRARVVKITGEIALGETGEGPYLVKIDWEAGPFPCAEIVGDVGGALAKGLAASTVSGTVRARGTVRGDLSEIDDLKKSVEILEACKLDVGKSLGGLLDGLPF
ncbi:MAG: hypothetical protein HYV09_25545 [Deltaproteobacteria bacterium]|nr:hypothetical protein [Deltaproteobacteria bacterium]